MNNFLHIECDITQRCNLKCIRCNRFCDISKNLNSDITTEELNKILFQFQKYSIKRFRIMGGEPTLNKELFSICNLLYMQKNITNIELMSNFINIDILKKIKKLFPKIIIYNLDGNTSQNIKYKKFIKHVNFFLSPKDQSIELPKNPCNIYNNYYDYNNCGIHIFKMDNKIKLMYSSVCSSVIRLLGHYDMFFDNIDNLLKSDHQYIYDIICQHCMMGVNFPILVKNNLNISKIFINGINIIKK